MSKLILCGECEHDLKYCKNCKIPYCSKCGKEWQEKVIYTSYPSGWYNTNYQIPIAEPAPVTCETKHGNK